MIQAANNYHYDAIGNLTADDLGGVYNIDWNVYGKLKSMSRTPHVPGDPSTIIYTYDPSGNRVGKTLWEYSDTGSQQWYVRDAQGNVMAVYKMHYNSNWSLGPLKLIEHHIYGSSRLGIIQEEQDMDSAKAEVVSENLIGNTLIL